MTRGLDPMGMPTEARTHVVDWKLLAGLLKCLHQACLIQWIEPLTEDPVHLRVEPDAGSTDHARKTDRCDVGVGPRDALQAAPLLELCREFGRECCIKIYFIPVVCVSQPIVEGG